jgi:hypothetical protein
VLWKCRPNQVSGLAIKLADTARDKVQYNWTLYLLNQFNDDCIAAQDHNQPFHYAWLLILIRLIGWKEPKQGIFLNTNLSFRGARYANLWVTSDPMKQDANNMVFYYYYDQLCKAISSSPQVTREVTNTYRKIMRFTADWNHIYLQSHAHQGNNSHISYYRMTQEDIEQVIKDQLEIWVENQEKEKGKGKEKDKDKEKGKEKKTKLEKDKEEFKEEDKGKTTIGEK